MREALVRVLTSPTNLDEQDYSERPVDRVHAVASAQYRAIDRARRAAILVPLGRLLLPIVDGQSDRFRKEAEEALSLCLSWKEYRLRVHGDISRAVARQAIHEAQNARCPVCKGITDVKDGVCSIPDLERMAGHKVWIGPVPLKPCPECNGTGKKKFSDEERARVVLDAVRYAEALAVAHSIISEATSMVLDQYRNILRGD